MERGPGAAPQGRRVPDEIVFRAKPLIAAEQIRQPVADGVPRAPVVAGAAYGNDTKFRQALLDMGLEYVVGIQPMLSVWPPGKEPLPLRPRKSMGHPPKLRQRAPNYQPVLAKDLAAALAPKEWQKIPWRDGTKEMLQSRFAAVRVRPANRDYERSEPLPEQWLVIKWPEEEAPPTQYWLESLVSDTSLTASVTTAKQRWIIARDYEELKQELGLGHYEGRGWRGFHHHATLCNAAYGFLIAERSRSSPRGPRWTAPTCPTRNSTRLETVRGERNAISRNRLRPYGSWSPACSQVDSRVARHVPRFVCNSIGRDGVAGGRLE